MRVAAVLFSFALLLSQAAAAAVQVAGKADVRLLIDVSGSMKHTDPRNLRQPATELLVRLLPGDAQAGIWTFGTAVDALVPHGPVDANWRERGLARAARIGSGAMHTDIPAALERALAQPLTAAGAASIILLTDGVVDVGTDPAANATARQRVMAELAPRLREAGVRVHTVALSDQADQELLAQLSLATDGFFAVADSAEELQKLFVQALDTAAPAEQLPLEDNQFLVDSSIDELTALVFHRGDALVLESPDGSRHSGKQHGEGFRWFGGEGFELITIAKPQVGRWRLEADTEAGSRVTIVSNLALATSQLIQNGFPDQPQRVKAQLQEQGTPLRQPELLALVNVHADVVRLDDGFRWDVPLMSDEPARYAAALPMLVEPGRYEVTVVADGKTFRRSWVQRVTVREHVAVQLGRVPAEGTATPIGGAAVPAAGAAHRIGIDVVNPAIDADASRLAVEGIAAEPQRTATGWRLEVPFAEERREIDLAVHAVRRDGTPLTIALDRLVLAGDSVAREAPPAAAVVPAVEPAAATEEPAAEQPAAAEVAEPNSWLLYTGLAIANLVLIGLIWMVVRTVRRGSGAKGRASAAVAATAAVATSTAGTGGKSEEIEAALPAAVDLLSPVGTAEAAPSVAALDGLDLADLDMPLDAIDLDPAADRR